jgi:mannose-6-phosphate isomerase-like protein (cupin superfamily)
MKVNRDLTERYEWGEHCEGWRLVDVADLSVIQERMPPGTRETRHFHRKSWQFFFVLRGAARIEMNGNQYHLLPQDGLEIPTEAPHQIFNDSNGDLEFLVISCPATTGDRVLSPIPRSGVAGR